MFNLTKPVFYSAFNLINPVIRSSYPTLAVTIGLVALSACGYYLAKACQYPADLKKREIRVIPADDPLYQRVIQRELQAKVLSSEEIKKYKEQSIDGDNIKQTDIVQKSCGFDPTLRMSALFKIIEKKSQKETYVDLREVAKDPEWGVTYYAPFTFNYERKITAGKINSGWLSLSFDKDRIYINRIETCPVFFRRKMGLGTGMVQFAIEKSLAAGFEGRVGLRSVYDSGVFYYKLGFISKDPEYQKQIEVAAREGKKINGLDMYLPEAAIAAWKEIIAKNPISFMP